MLGSRVCWQLLLGWALLLGQPVFGDSGPSSSEEHSLQEPEKTLAEEPENLLPESEESEEQVPVQEGPVEKKPPSDEELEEMEEEERAWLKHEKKKPCGSWLQYLQAIALGHYNKEQNEYYKLHGDVILTAKKAIGTVAYLKMVLVKTNCTNDLLPEEMHRSRSLYGMYHYHQFPKHCESLKGSEKECTFTLLSDERRRYYHPPSVISEKCKPMHLSEKRYEIPSFNSRS